MQETLEITSKKDEKCQLRYYCKAFYDNFVKRNDNSSQKAEGMPLATIKRCENDDSRFRCTLGWKKAGIRQKVVLGIGDFAENVAGIQE